MTIKTIIKQELDKIHGDVHYIDTSREEVDDAVMRVVSTLLDEIERDVNNLKSDNDYDIKHCKESNQDYFYGGRHSLNDVLSTLNKYRV